MPHLLTLAEMSERVRTGTWRGALMESSAGGAAPDVSLVERMLHVEELLGELEHGDRVIVRTSNSVASVSAFLGVWALGGVAVPVPADTPQSSLAKVAADCNARFVLSPGLERAVELSPDYRPEPPRFVWRRRLGVSGSDLALIIYTSGSTGTPKGILLTHNNVVSALYAIIAYLKLDSTDTILCVSPLTFDYGLYQALIALAADLTTVLFDEYVQPLAVVRALNRHAVTVLPVVPALALALDRTIRAYRMELPTLRKITNTGGHLGTETINGLRDQIPGVTIYAMYGLTECKRALYLPPEDLDRKMGSVGIPMPGLEARVMRLQEPDADGPLQEADAHEVGELYVRGASVMQGYSREDAGAGARILPGRYRDDNWLATGDLFYADDDGYLYFRGRIKNLIKQGGYCLYPLDLEEAIMQHTNVHLAAVVGITDSDDLEVAHAFIELTENDEQRRKELRAWMQQTIEPEYRPRKIHFVDRIPLGSTGKVDKPRLIREFAP